MYDENEGEMTYNGCEPQILKELLIRQLSFVAFLCQTVVSKLILRMKKNTQVRELR